MIKKSFKKLFLIALLSGFLCSPSMMAQQIDNNQSDEVLDLNFMKTDPLQFNGSSYTIEGEMLRNMPVTHLANLLSGLIPGFYSKQSSGSVINEQPGYWIRGRRTTSEGVLVLVDGQEREFGSLSSFEVEKITVLKDAAAIALYGMRAANGAILVTTRRGEKGKPKIEFSAQMIDQQPLRVPRPVNASDYASYYNEAYKNDNPGSTTTPYPDPSLYLNSPNPELYPDVDWYDKLYDQDQFMQRYNLNVSGGTNRTRYFVNFGSMSHEGMFNTDKSHTYSTDSEFRRYNLRSNFEVDVTPTTILTADVYGWYETQNRPNNSTINSFTALLNTPANAFPMYYTDNGRYKDQSGQQITGRDGKILTQNAVFGNPWTVINENGYAIYTEVYGSFRVRLNQDLSMWLPGLQASGDISLDSKANWETNRTKTNAYYELINDSTMKKTGTDGTMSNSVGAKNSNRSLSLNMQINYAGQFGKHGISALAFYTQYENTNDVSIPARMQGINGWVGYNYDKRYGIDLLASYSGSYKFAKGKRFGFFPTVSAGWTISNESFFENAKSVINFLKIRGSAGQLGSDRGVDAHQFLSAMTGQTAVYNFGNSMGSVAGYLETQVANPDVTWEKSLLYNIAVEGRLFNDRLNFTAEFFRDNRSDIYLTNNNIGGLYGITGSFRQNIGSMYSQGVDLGLQWSAKTGKLNYNAGITYS